MLTEAPRDSFRRVLGGVGGGGRDGGRGGGRGRGGRDGGRGGGRGWIETWAPAEEPIAKMTTSPMGARSNEAEVSMEVQAFIIGQDRPWVHGSENRDC